jgi:hypothetical protein
MTHELIERSRQRDAFVGLPVILITLSLAVSLAIAATAVSIGIARADTLMPATSGSNGRLMFVLFVGFVIASMGGLTAVMVKNEVSPQRRD